MLMMPLSVPSRPGRGPTDADDALAGGQLMGSYYSCLYLKSICFFRVLLQSGVQDSQVQVWLHLPASGVARDRWGAQELVVGSVLGGQHAFRF